MAKIASQYPITTGYGCLKGYPLNYCGPGKGFHRGVDRAMPVGTGVVVNGVEIANSGKTGYVTGPHLHIGRWVNGVVTNPGTGGFAFANAVVTQVDNIPNDANGKFVRIQADGASWVYLHLSEIKCKVGQKLKVSAPLPIPIIRKFYTVVSGDTVTRISARYGISIDTFRKLNPGIVNINYIYVGQVVRVK